MSLATPFSWSPPVAARFYAWTGRWEVSSSILGHPCRLSRFGLWTWLFGFHGFLRNSRKYELGSLIKTLTEGTPHTGPGPTCGLLTLFYNSASLVDSWFNNRSSRGQKLWFSISRGSFIFEAGSVMAMLNRNLATVVSER